ncbi:BRCA1-associated protein [Sitodiplosis mosellana]|uniref:BRCA1-associated protein n=1 Tax=Sitodiplosis mosellana TaxID=263140 RepID=UPI0024444A34|nr:BRCA1-associated protein [Sitodiplosis mosellana]
MSILVSLCHIKFEIDLSTAMDGTKNSKGAAAVCVRQNPHNDQRQPRKITVENFTNKQNDGDAKDGKGILPSGSRETTPMTDDTAKTTIDEKGFFYGNPFVEVTKGIMHIYKKNERTEITDDVSKMLCLLAVPATLNCHDILNFVAPCHSTIQHIRIIRDGTPNQFMVLLEFRSTESAVEFYKTFNGIPYNSLEPDSMCHAVWVSNVVWGEDGLPPFGHTELPTCPVCLERMDESVDGVLTILCNHAFHSNCLIKWGDSTCPVCRCVQTPELAESSVCMECEGIEALWICLICGHVGCGRYQGGHAASHYKATNHTYALQLGTNRVWDYAGDNFVHRLLQSKGDGKLVAHTQSPTAESADSDEKIDSLQLEFTYALTSQLQKQREYYEEKLARLESKIDSDSKQFQVKIDTIITDFTDLDMKYTTLRKEKTNVERKLAQLNSKLTNCQKELNDEREMIKALRSNQSGWETKCSQLDEKFKKYQTEKEAEIIDLKDEIRDLMFYMEAQNVVANSKLKDEIDDTSIIISPPSTSGASGSKKGRQKKK